MSTTPPAGGPPNDPGQPYQPGHPGQPMGQPGQPAQPYGHPNQPVQPNQPYGQQPPGYGQPIDQTAQWAAPGGPAGPGDVVGDQPSGSGKGRGFMPWIIGLVVVLVIGGGAFAVRAAMGGNADAGAAASVMPADTILYGQVDIEPSVEQRAAAAEFLGAFPGANVVADVLESDMDLRERIWDLVQQDTPELDGIDYDTDIEPWLGTTIAFGMTPTDGGSPEDGIVIAIEASDEDAARATFDDLAESAGGDAPGIAFADGFAVIAKDQATVDGFVADAAEGSLADDEQYQSDMAELGETGFATFWMSKDALSTLSQYAATGDPMVDSQLPMLEAQAANLAMALRFDGSYAELAVVQTGSGLEVSGSDGTNPVATLPDSTLLGFGAKVGEGTYEEGWEYLTDMMAGSGMDLQSQLDLIEQQTGLSLPNDLVTLLGEGLAFAVDGEGLADIVNLQDPADLRIGLVLDTDPAAAGEVLDKIEALMGPGFSLEQVERDGLLGVALNPEYADELTSGSLADTDGFKAAVPDGADADFVMYFNMDQLEQVDLLMGEIDPEVMENLEPIQAIGMSGSFDGSTSTATFRVVVN